MLLLGLYMLLKAKAYYLGPVYPMLFAAGVGVLERAVRGRLPRVKHSQQPDAPRSACQSLKR